MHDKVIMGLSGGMDSATLLGYYLDKHYEVHCCLFTYGSKHNKYENQAAENIINYYIDEHGCSIYVHKFDLSNLFLPGASNLLKSGGEIPEGHYNDETMKLTVVPGRNMIFISIMASLAESLGAKTIALGVHSGDHHIYPDCRPEFIHLANLAVLSSTEGKVMISTPFLNDDKAGILHRGYFDFNYKVPYNLTRTCYKDQSLSCGKCGSCRERLEAFHNLGIDDPIEYEK